MTLVIWLFVTTIVFAWNFGSKIRRNGQESLFWESLYLAQRRHLYAESAGSDPENSDSGGRETCQLYVFLSFCCPNWKNNTKINRKKSGGKVEGARPPRPSSKSAHGPYGVLLSCYPDGYSTASSISYILSIPNLDSIFFPFPTPQCFPFKYLSLWLLNPQSLPSNEASLGSQKTFWRPASIKVQPRPQGPGDEVESKLSHWALPHLTQNCTRS